MKSERMRWGIPVFDLTHASDPAFVFKKCLGKVLHTVLAECGIDVPLQAAVQFDASHQFNTRTTLQLLGMLAMAYLVQLSRQYQLVLYSPYSRSWHPHGAMSWQGLSQFVVEQTLSLGMFG